jgi:signal peptidase I
MENTLLIGDVLYVNKMVYGAKLPLIGVRLPAIREPRRGELVVFDSVEEEGLKVVKRLIGVPGDTLAMEKGQLIRDGKPVDEPWVASGNRLQDVDEQGRNQIRSWQVSRLVGGETATYAPDANNWGPIVVPDSMYFVMGDKRRESYDSRFWGFLPRDNIRGRPVIIYYSYDPETYKPLPLLTNTRWNRLFTVPR